MSDTKKTPRTKKEKTRMPQPQMGPPPPPPPQGMPPPGMPPPPRFIPPPQMPYPPGPFQFPSDPNQQRLLQIQIRQQQLQLQQMQQRSQHAAAQQQHQQHSAASNKPPNKQQATPQAPHAMNAPQPLPPQPPPLTNMPPASPATINNKKSSSPLPSKKTVAPPPSQQQVNQWLSQCDWKDKTIYVSRQLLGGSNINGFNRATSNSLKTKKARARQVKLTKRKAAEQAGMDNESQNMTVSKLDVLNPRTAKKLKGDFQHGAAFCQHLYQTVASLMRDLDPTGMLVIPPITHAISSSAPPIQTTTTNRTKMSTTSSKSTVSSSSYSSATSTKSKTKSSTPTTSTTAIQNTSGVQGSSLRKLRKRKLATHPLDFELQEFHVSGKRLYSKKEHYARIASVLRFRALKGGDYVAARLDSRDLWILARVAHEYPAIDMDPTEFLKLSTSKRDALFRTKVIVKDAEEKAAAEPIAVARQFILPLPRTYAEAAEWGSRLKKGLRIYAMYPHTTSLYVATVIDNTTYCRGDDDVIVVEFDEDERDATGALPKCHIPARFCVAIPREFQKKKTPTTSTKQADPKPSKRTSSKTKQAATTVAAAAAPTDPTLNNMLSEMDDALGEFNPLVDFSGGN